MESCQPIERLEHKKKKKKKKKKMMMMMVMMMMMMAVPGVAHNLQFT
jgi:accessory gene regulator protein AgrB